MNVYTFAEASKILRVSTRTLYNMEKRGEIEVVRYANRKFIKESEIKRILKED